MQEKLVEREQMPDSSEIEKTVKEFGIEPDQGNLQTAQEAIKIKLHNGQELNLGQYEALIEQTIRKYYKFGIAWKVKKMWQDQAKSDKCPPYDELGRMWMLVTMAEKEWLIGLKPIDHTIPLMGQVYVTIEGRKYHARKTGVDFTVDIETIKDGTKDNVWKKKATITLDGGKKISAEGKATPSDVNKVKWVEEMASKRSLARALDLVFPIGASAEDAVMDADFATSSEEPPELIQSFSDLGRGEENGNDKDVSSEVQSDTNEDISGDLRTGSQGEDKPQEKKGEIPD